MGKSLAIIFDSRIFKNNKVTNFRVVVFCLVTGDDFAAICTSNPHFSGYVELYGLRSAGGMMIISENQLPGIS